MISRSVIPYIDTKADVGKRFSSNSCFLTNQPTIPQQPVSKEHKDLNILLILTKFDDINIHFDNILKLIQYNMLLSTNLLNAGNIRKKKNADKNTV